MAAELRLSVPGWIDKRLIRMNEDSLVRAVPDLVLAGWGRTTLSVTRLGGGMNSATAVVELTDGRFVAKWVPEASAAALATGCRIAQLLAGHGLVTGEPLPTVDGSLTSPTDRGALALLRFAAGEPLSASSLRDQHDIAVTLARVHAVEPATTSGPFMSEQIVGLVHDVERWVRPTVRLVFG